jgi:hypothetical protein
MQKDLSPVWAAITAEKMILFIKHYLNTSTGSKRRHVDKMQPTKYVWQPSDNIDCLPNSSTLHGPKHRHYHIEVWCWTASLTKLRFSASLRWKMTANRFTPNSNTINSSYIKLTMESYKAKNKTLMNQ